MGGVSPPRGPGRADNLLLRGAVPANPVSTSPLARPHLFWIDWLRFLAAFAVLTDHARAFNWDGMETYRDAGGSPALTGFIALFSLGRQAVVVFFVLSGWLVGGYAAERVRAGTFDVAGYAADRISRVYVPLVPALLFTLALVRGLGGFVDLRQYAVCLVGLQKVSGVPMPGANGVLWSLGYEIWFYVLAGGAAVLCQRGGAAWVRCAGAAAAALAVGVCVGLGWMYLACWLAGTACGLLRSRLAPAARPWTALAGALVIAAASAVYLMGRGILPAPDSGFTLPPTGVAQLLVAGGAVLLAAGLADLAPRTGFGRQVERAGGRLAAFSYTLYLVHFPLLGATRAVLGPVPQDAVDGPAFGRLFGMVALCVVAALGMYALFERQTPRVRRWLRARLGGGAPSRPLPAGRPTLAAGV